MNSGKIVAIITGAVSILLAIAYLILVQLLDIRGEMIPVSSFNNQQISIYKIVSNYINNFEVLDEQARIL